MTPDNLASLQVVWEQLNASLYDVEQGDPRDAVPALEDCIQILEKIICTTDKKSVIMEPLQQGAAAT